MAQPSKRRLTMKRLASALLLQLDESQLELEEGSRDLATGASLGDCMAVIDSCDGTTTEAAASASGVSDPHPHDVISEPQWPLPVAVAADCPPRSHHARYTLIEPVETLAATLERIRSDHTGGNEDVIDRIKAHGYLPYVEIKGAASVHELCYLRRWHSNLQFEYVFEYVFGGRPGSWFVSMRSLRRKLMNES